MKRFVSSSLAGVLALGLAGCVAAHPAPSSPMNGPDYVFTQSRGNGLMPRAQADVAQVRLEGRAVSERERRTRR